MKPKDLFFSCNERYMFRPLSTVGFKFLKSGPRYTWKYHDEFRLEFYFQFNRYNYDDNCEFWTGWSIHAKSILKWYEKEWGTKPTTDSITGEMDWNIPGWTNEYRINLTNSERDEEECKRFVHNAIHVGVPYFTHVTDWEKAAEFAARDWKSLHRWDDLSDLFLIAGKPDNAKEILLYGYEFIKKKIEQGGKDQLFQLPEIEKRLERYFPSTRP